MTISTLSANNKQLEISLYRQLYSFPNKISMMNLWVISLCSLEVCCSSLKQTEKNAVWSQLWEIPHLCHCGVLSLVPCFVYLLRLFCPECSRYMWSLYNIYTLKAQVSTSLCSHFCYLNSLRVDWILCSLSWWQLYPSQQFRTQWPRLIVSPEVFQMSWTQSTYEENSRTAWLCFPMNSSLETCPSGQARISPRTSPHGGGR